MKYKEEASGWPDNVTTNEEKKRHIQANAAVVRQDSHAVSEQARLGRLLFHAVGVHVFGQQWLVDHGMLV